MEKPYLLYLPGLDGTGRLIQRQTALLDAYHVIAHSYPQDQATTYERLAEKAAERLAAQTRGRPAVVLAESFGGAVGLHLVLNAPHLVEQLILVNTFAYYPRRFLVRLGAWLSYLLPNLPVGKRIVRLSGPLLFSPDLPRVEREMVWERVSDVPMSVCGKRLRMLVGLDLRSRLSEITRPTLVFVSPNDRLVKPSAGRKLVESIPKAKLVEQPVGHTALIHPAVNVLDWLNEKSNRPT